MRPRTIFYIDAFNVYFGLLRQGKLKRCKWVNIQEYLELLRWQDDIQKINFFISRVKGKNAEKQEQYIQALRTCPKVEQIFGYMVTRPTYVKLANIFSKPHFQYKRSQEKRTDVNIAVKMMDDAIYNRCDNMVLISADSDLVPTVRWVRDYFDSQDANKKIIVYVPVGKGSERWESSYGIRQFAHKSRVLPTDLLEYTQFPDEIKLESGRTINKPEDW